MLPCVSVIIPNYNHVQFLQQRIDTVLNQSYQNIEVIILDDCSSDGSIEIINRYQGHKKVKSVVINGKNSGSAFKQWEKGLELATGEWVWIAESDDYADTKFIETMLNRSVNSPVVGLIYCDSVIVERNGSLSTTFAALKNEKFKTTRWSTDYFNDGLNEIENYLLPYGTINNTSAVIFRTSILKKEHPFDLSLKFIGDKYAFLKVLSTSHVCYVSEPLNFYRDPFTQKHFDKFIHYFYEHFLILNWAKKTAQVNSRAFRDATRHNLRNSIFRKWNRYKLQVYWKSLRLNPIFFLEIFMFNVFSPLIDRIKSRE